MLEQFADLTPHQRVERYYTAVTAESCRRSLRKFVKSVWPLVDPAPFSNSWHIDAICLPYETIITTDSGPMTIGHMVESGWSGEVLSFCHKTNKAQWKSVKKLIRSPRQELYVVKFNNGSVLHITGNHPVYIKGRGYTQASEIRPGESALHLRSMRDPFHVETEAVSTRALLQHEVFRIVQSEAGEVHLPKMREAEGVGSESLYVVPGYSAIAKQTRSLLSLRKACLSLIGAVERQLSALWGVLQSRMPRALYSWAKQPGIHSRAEASKISEFVSQIKTCDQEARRESVLSLSLNTEIGNSSHRLEQKEQQSIESCNPVQGVSHEAESRQHPGRDFEVVHGTISSIERSARVCDNLYNLEVADNNNYFAHGVLVHNCDHLAYVQLGDIRNLMINVPPRSSKSSVVSAAFPAWVWCDQPEEQFLCASYSADLAKLDAAKMRRIVESEWYQSRYPNVTILSDENRVDRFSNTEGGYRTTISVGSRTTGLGGGTQILDDPHNLAEIEHKAATDLVKTWHDGAWRSRVNNPNTARRIYVGQRGGSSDLFAHVLEKEEKRWVVLSLPMEYDHSRKCITYRNKGKGPEGDPIFKDPRTKPGSLLCPDRYDEDAVEREKEAVSKRVWEAQFQQNPEGAGGKIWKRQWWRKWEWPNWHPEYRKSARPMPEFIEIIQSYDTAFEEGEQDSFSVRTTWGLFLHSEMKAMDKGRIGHGEERVNAILLERKKWRPSFGELRDEAVESWHEWADAGVEPDRILVEKKASGHSLIKELRAKKLPVRAVKVQGDLVYRAHMASLPLQKGAIWYVDTNWAKSFVDVCAKYPDVDFDDEISSAAIALMYMRKHMDLQLEDDDDNEEDLSLFDPKIVRSFYG